jgi:hypothetical protein
MMMYVRFPLSLRNARTYYMSAGSTSAKKRFGSVRHSEKIPVQFQPLASFSQAPQVKRRKASTSSGLWQAWSRGRYRVFWENPE